jgi:hypothetical protein
MHRENMKRGIFIGYAFFADAEARARIRGGADAAGGVGWPENGREILLRR